MFLPHYDLFVSYSREDSERVRPLVEALRVRGYRVFFDLESIRIGEPWKRRLEVAVRGSRALLLCWSARARTSEYVQFEYHKAEGLGRKVLPWLLDKTPLPAMVEIQAITTEDPAGAAAVVSQQIGWTVTRRRWAAITAAGVLGAGAVGVWWEAQNTSFDLWGAVTDQESRPLAGVKVSCSLGALSAVTDTRGRFRLTIKGKKPDSVKLTFTKEGYRDDFVYASTETSAEKPFVFALIRR